MAPDSMTQTVPTQLPAEWRDFFALTKPRVMSLVIFTGLCGLLAAPGSIHPVLGFTAILCIALGAGGAAALNQWWEADIDAGMKRTAARPLPSGRMNRTDARDFGVLISAACEACKKRKTKCTGGPPPCQLCESLGTECVIDLSLDMRRRAALQRTIDGASRIDRGWRPRGERCP